MYLQLTHKVAGEFAKSLDDDFELKDVPPEKKGIAHFRNLYGGYVMSPEERKRGEEEAQAKYVKGKEILTDYSLSYSARFVKGAADGKAEILEKYPDAEFLYVDAGYIATSEAERLAIFKPRK